MSPPTIDVFVVFDGDDAARARALSTALRAFGLRTFSRHDLRPGDVWTEVLPANLRRARSVAVIISTAWDRPRNPAVWYGPEQVALAIEAAQTVDPPPRLIPVMVDGALDRVPFGLARVQGVQVAGDDFTDAAGAIAGVLDPTDADGPPRPHSAVDAARERLEALRAAGASLDTQREAERRVLEARKSARDGPAHQAGELFADRYLLLDRVGAGGFATVWHARDLRTGGDVAVKILHGRWSHDRSRIERFERGAERMKALVHPSVVRVLDGPSSQARWHFYAMEYLPGGDLAAARTRLQDPLPAEAAVAAVLTVADALAVAHRRGMVHRDIKPHNIVLDADGRARLTDFDLVRADDSTGGTRTGALGTFLFAAPESLRAGKDATPATDVYGLAVTTVFALTGEVPPEIIRAPEAVVAGLPTSARVKAVLRSALDWEPSRRPRDAAAFAAALREALATRRTAAPAAPAATGSAARRPRVLAVAASLGALVVAAVVVMAVDPPGADDGGEEAPNRLRVDVSPPPAPDAAITRSVVMAVDPPGADDGGEEAPNRLRVDVSPPPAPDAGITRNVVMAVDPPGADDGGEEAPNRLRADVSPPPAPDAGITRNPASPPPGFVVVPAGLFEMGSPPSEAGRDDDEGPQHTVTFTRPLWIQAHEVTHDEWSRQFAHNPSHRADCARCPVEQVNWYEAAAFANARSRDEGLEACYTLTDCTGEPGQGMACARAERVDDCTGYRLPTEAEWEYFARAGTTTRFWSGETDADLARAGWYDANSGGQTHRAGEKWANPWGLYDVHGNVWEWTESWFGGYGSAPPTDPAGRADGSVRVIRGGSFILTAHNARSAYRGGRRPVYRHLGLGFRLVRAPEHLGPRPPGSPG